MSKRPRNPQTLREGGEGGVILPGQRAKAEEKAHPAFPFLLASLVLAIVGAIGMNSGVGGAAAGLTDQGQGQQFPQIKSDSFIGESILLRSHLSSLELHEQEK